jgi:type VI secretion system protein ImpK
VSRLQRWLPARAVAALGLVVLAGVFAGLGWSLGRQAEPVYAELARLGQDRRGVAPAPQVQRTLTLREALAPDIAAGLVEVVEQARGSTVAIRGDAFFGSGSAAVESGLQPLLARIAAALNRFPGAVLVSGHTDDQPVGLGRRLRYATNWELSQARAEAVAALLAPRLDQPARLMAEGRGDAEARQPNDTPAHRAQNRRVEVTLLGTATTAVAAAALPTPGPMTEAQTQTVSRSR